MPYRNPFLNALQAASNSVAGNLSGPVDMLNMGMGLLGLPVSEKPVGGSAWLREKGLLGEVRPGASQVIGETMGLVGPTLAAAYAPQIARGLLAAGEAMPAPSMGRRIAPNQDGKIVWHGSPHKFDKFDSSKIGTGEGAQVYGHGLYVAESPEVAGSYAKIGFSKHRRANDMAESLYLDRWNTVSELEKQKAAGVTRFGVKWNDIWDRRLKEALADAEKRGPRPENFYKIDLADDAIPKMLDWDKPLEKQAPEVRKAISDYIALSGKEHYTPSGESVPVVIRQGISGSTTGKQFYDWLSKNGGATDAADNLRFAGIPGIRYLDGGSRGAGQGTYNYVVFPGNENLLKILERNGVPVGLLD